MKADLTQWLLEPDNPSARYLALTRLLDRPPDAPDVLTVQAAIPNARPARAILDAQYPGSDDPHTPGGYWVKADLGYSPKYRATMWQLIFLAQLGAPPVGSTRRACEYVLQHSRHPSDGRFVASRGPHSAVDCLNGNMLRTLQWFGFSDDARLVQAREATAQAIGRRGFACRFNGGLPCAWGAVKVLLAFLAVPPERRSADVEAAVVRATELLLSAHLVEAAYPASRGVSKRWFTLTFPLGYSADLLEAMTALTLAGRGEQVNVRSAIQWLLDKRDPTGRWILKHTPGKMWASCGGVGRPNKWVTLRALHLLKMLGLVDSSGLDQDVPGPA